MFGILLAAGWLADRFRRDRVLKCCAVASCGELTHELHLHGDPQSYSNLIAPTMRAYTDQAASRKQLWKERSVISGNKAIT